VAGPLSVSMRLVHLGQQRDIGVAVPRREAPSPAAPVLHRSGFRVLADQRRYLRPAQAVHFRDVTLHQTFAASARTCIFLCAQSPLRPLI